MNGNKSPKSSWYNFRNRNCIFGVSIGKFGKYKGILVTRYNLLVPHWEDSLIIFNIKISVLLPSSPTKLRVKIQIYIQSQEQLCVSYNNFHSAVLVRIKVNRMMAYKHPSTVIPPNSRFLGLRKNRNREFGCLIKVPRVWRSQGLTSSDWNRELENFASLEPRVCEVLL